jgi:signal transduction histidine kinase
MRSRSSASVPAEHAGVYQYPLVRDGAADAAGFVAIVRRLAVARTISEVMQITTQAARSLMRADGVTFVLRDGDLCYYAEEDAVSPLWKGRRFPMSACISGWCMTEEKPAVIPDIYADPRIPHDAYRPTFVRSLAMVPVRHEQAAIAAMGAYWARTRMVTSEELELLETVANSAALAIAFVETQQAPNDGLRKLTAEIAQSRESERRRIARELHDTTCQDLVAASLAVAGLERLVGPQQPAGHKVMVELGQTLDRALNDLRTLSYVLLAPTTSASPLAHTLRTLITGFASRAGIKVRFSTKYAGRPSDGIERAIIAIVQEALMNIHRHSGSKTAYIALGMRKGSLILTIGDQGKWREGPEGVGIASMRERIAEVGGTLSVRATHRGTRLSALVPIHTESARSSTWAA